MWVKKCVEICVMLFKNWKHVLKHMYQMGPSVRLGQLFENMSFENVIFKMQLSIW